MRKVGGWILIVIGGIFLISWVGWIFIGLSYGFYPDEIGVVLFQFLVGVGCLIPGVWLIRKKRKLYAKLITKNGNRRVGPFRSREELELWYNRVDDWKDVERIDVVRG